MEFIVIGVAFVISIAGLFFAEHNKKKRLQKQAEDEANKKNL